MYSIFYVLFKPHYELTITSDSMHLVSIHYQNVAWFLYHLMTENMILYNVL